MAALFALALVGGVIAVNVVAITVATIRRDGWHGVRHFLNS